MAIPAFEVVFFPSESMLLIKKTAENSAVYDGLSE